MSTIKNKTFVLLKNKNKKIIYQERNRKKNFFSFKHILNKGNFQTIIAIVQLKLVHISAILMHLSSADCKNFLQASQMVSLKRQRIGTDFNLMFRILKALRFLGFLVVMTVLFVVYGLTISDLLAAIISFMPCGWAIILVSQNFCILEKHKLRTIFTLSVELSIVHLYVMSWQIE